MMKNVQQLFLSVFKFFFLMFFLLMFGCGQQSEIGVVNKSVLEFFSSYRQYDYRKMDRHLFTDTLSQLLDQAAAREDKEIEIVLTSDYPSDKPFIIDEDIFTSTVDGADSILICKTLIKGDSAWVDVLFSNSQDNSYFEWNDQLLFLKKEDWKLDNVFYKAENSTFNSLQDFLFDYIHTQNEF